MLLGAELSKGQEQFSPLQFKAAPPNLKMPNFGEAKVVKSVSDLFLNGQEQRKSFLLLCLEIRVPSGPELILVMII